MRSLGLMCGAGPLPARMATEATRLGWRIVAFTFPGATEPAGWADVVIPSRIEAMNPVLEGLAREKIAGMLFSGKFWMGDLLGAAAADTAHAKMAARAGALLDDNITRAIVETLTAFGVELLDQRPFFGDWLEPAGCCSRRAPTEAEWADVVIPSRIEAMNPVLEALAREKIAGMLFSGKFWMGDLLGAAAADAAHTKMATRAGALLDDNITRAIVETLTAFGVELLDQRPFFGDWLEPAGCCSRRAPTDAEWADVRRGLAVTRLMAGAQIGQAVVVRRGVVSAVEAIEGTTEAIRRGTALGGPGSVIVKGVAPAHDFRFDTPGIGPDTLDAAVAGGAAVVAIEAGRVAIIDRAAVVARADAADLALVSVDAAE